MSTGDVSTLAHDWDMPQIKVVTWHKSVQSTENEPFIFLDFRSLKPMEKYCMETGLINRPQYFFNLVTRSIFSRSQIIILSRSSTLEMAKDQEVMGNKLQ